MKETIEFKGIKVTISIRKPRSRYDHATVTYPCGAQRKYGDMDTYRMVQKSQTFGARNEHLRHVEKCLACKIVLGLSKAKVLQRQQQVANLFGIGKDGFRTSGEFYASMEAKDGFLTYHGDIRAVRTTKGIIMNDQLRYIRSGFSSVYVPEPTKNVIAKIPLGTIRALLNYNDFEWMKEIEVLDQDRKGFLIRNTLISIRGKRLLITRDTNGRQYVIELPILNGSETVADAYECLKPFIVKQYENLGVKVQRQGEFFFVPLERVKDEHVRDIQKVVRKVETYAHFGEQTTDTTLEFPSVDNQEDTHHKATRHGFYKGFNVVKGTVRHDNRDHKMLKLGDVWHIVAKNMQVASLTVETGNAD